MVTNKAGAITEQYRHQRERIPPSLGRPHGPTREAEMREIRAIEGMLSCVAKILLANSLRECLAQTVWFGRALRRVGGVDSANKGLACD